MMETCMVSRSCYVDSIILNKLLLLLTKYCNLKSKIDFLIHPKNKRKRLHVRRSSSFSSFKDLPETSKIPLNLNFYPENQARNSSRSTSCSSSYDKCKYVYTIDQYWTLDTIFSSMIDRYKAKTWVRNYNTNPEAHICIVRQFWLDCYVCDQTFWHLLNEPIGRCSWINCEMFIKCLENLYETSTWNIFTYKFMGKKYKKTFKLLKKLCNRNLVFFRIKQLETGDDLTRENLVQALKMSDRAPKHHLEMLANLMIKKCNEFRAKNSTKISFKEYEKMIINRVRFVV